MTRQQLRTRYPLHANTETPSSEAQAAAIAAFHARKRKEKMRARLSAFVGIVTVCLAFSMLVYSIFA